jgi:hypothetical protein
MDISLAQQVIVSKLYYVSKELFSLNCPVVHKNAIRTFKYTNYTDYLISRWDN